MADFVSSDDTFKMVSMSLLANVLVTENLESANKLARLLNYNYKIVTLDGDVVHRGGSMTGGKNKNESSLITANQEKSDIEKQLLSVKAQAEIEAKNFAHLGEKKSRLEGELTAKRIAIAQLEPVVEAKKAKYLKLENDLAALNPQKEGDNITENAALKKLSSAYALRDDLANALKNKKELRLRLSNEVDRNDQQMRQLRSKLSEANKSLRSLSSDNATLNAKLEYDLKRLADTYEMTYEYAKDHYHMDIDEELKNEVKVLRNSLQNMGSVNMNAPEEYAEVKERYDFTKQNYDDLIASRDKILKAIEEMDVIMKKQFLDTFNKINNELNDTFKALFGGGKAKLVLEDENDILNTGIDIDVQPPGKAVKSIRLFSGGEKTLIAICVLFTILKIRPVPLIVFDEVEAALDQANVERFAKYIKTLSKQSQFIIITHRPGTMAQCDVLYGVTMQKRGVSQMLKVKLVEAISMAEKEEGNELS